MFHNLFWFYMSDSSYSLAPSPAQVPLGSLWEMLTWAAEKWALH